MRCEMHDRVDIVLCEDALQVLRVARLTDDQFACRDSLPKAGTQVIEYYDVFARGTELPHDVAADVAGTAGDQYLFCDPFARTGSKVYQYWSEEYGPGSHNIM
jgi:hypothetical protein